MLHKKPNAKQRARTAIIELRELEEEVGRMLLKIDEKQKFLQGYFDRQGLREMIVDTDETTRVGKSIKYIAKVSERANVNYDLSKLKQALDDEVFKEITKREYTITDIDKMVSLVKGAGISAKEFKEFLDVKVTLDRAALKALYDAGEITMKDLKGTYTATINRKIKISEVKVKDEEEANL